MLTGEEEDEDDSTALSLYRQLLGINYYERIEPIDYTSEGPPLTKVPNTFSSVEVLDSAMAE